MAIGRTVKQKQNEERNFPTMMVPNSTLASTTKCPVLYSAVEPSYNKNTGTGIERPDNLPLCRWQSEKQ